MKIPLLLQQIYPLLKFEIIRGYHFFKSNDVAKLYLFSAFIISCNSANITTQNFDTQMAIGVMVSIITMFCMIYLICSLYYLSFKIKKTEYNLPRVFYFCVIIIGVLHFLMKFCTATNIPAMIFYQISYILILLGLAIELRKVFIQQYLNVKNSVFCQVTEKTGLIIIASTPSGLFSSKTNFINHYMIGFNKNIKTWLVLGVFLKMDKEGIYLKKVLMTYNEVVMFNNTFDKIIIDYTQDELDTAIMYSI